MAYQRRPVLPGTSRTVSAVLGVVVAAGTLVTQSPAGPADWATAAAWGVACGLILAWRLRPQPDPDPTPARKDPSDDH